MRTTHLAVTAAAVEMVALVPLAAMADMQATAVRADGLKVVRSMWTRDRSRSRTLRSIRTLRKAVIGGAVVVAETAVREAAALGCAVLRVVKLVLPVEHSAVGSCWLRQLQP